MSTTEAEFFREKRPWSRIKDQVLESYMTPYLAKVAKLQQPILLIDGFAGPGAFDDGSIGSPLIMVQAAEERVKKHYIAIFVNKYAEHHSRLESALSSLARQGKVFPIHGDSQALLQAVQPLLGSQTLFLYLDPFGLKGCEFDTIRPFLERDIKHSTEMVLNMSAPTMHRLATWPAVKDGRGKDSKCKALHRRLTLVLGGEWWKDIMWTDTDPEAKVAHVIECYGKQIRAYLPYTGSCPVREREGAGLKYFITFCSRHFDAMELMNDIMRNAYQGRLHEAWVKDTLFQNTRWTDWTPSNDRDLWVLQQVERKNGASRKEVWADIIQHYFMAMTSSEFKDSVKRLCRQGKLRFEDTRGTGRLNDDSKLHATVTGT